MILQYILSIVCYCLGLTMFKIKTEYKIGILLLMFQLFSFLRAPVVGRATFFIPICFLISEIKNFRKIKTSLKKSVVWTVLKIFLISVLFLIIYSPHLHDFGSIRYVLQEEVLFRYFLLAYSFYACKNIKDFKAIINISLVGLSVMTIFGIVNYVTKNSYYVGALMSSYTTSSMFDGINLGAMFKDSSRFRVNSTFMNPFDYGFMCIVLALLYSYAYLYKLIKKNLYYIALFACLFGIFTCGSRTVILTGMIASLVYMLSAFHFGKTLKVSFLAVLLSLLAYQTIPYVNQKVDFALSALDKNSTEEGSSVDGRAVQYAAVLYHIQDDLLFGKGYMYFTIDLGWGKGKAYAVDRDLFGLEGVAMNYLLERGIVGYLFYLVFYIILVIYLFKHRKYGIKEYALGISVLTAYFVYSNMTGELLSLQPTLLILGCALGILNNKINYVSKNINSCPGL